MLNYSDVIEKTSITKAVWQLYPTNTRDIVTIQQKFNLSEIVARILSARNIPLEKIQDFLYPTLRCTLPDPFHLLDMDKAMLRIKDAILKHEKIVVFGDYDVDGATSSALIKNYFRMLGIDITIYIPDRIEEGYGPNTQAFKNLRDLGFNLCITVDCGTLAYEPIRIANSIGLDIIVIDHHLSTNTLPNAVAIINPNRLDQQSDCTNLAAVGVTFLLLIALNKTLREDNFFNDNKKEPDLKTLLDLVALGTVCDIMSITGLNRALVFQGLKIMSMRNNLGLKILFDVIGLDDKPNTYTLGFGIGPHINAGGRIGEASLGSKLLSTHDVQEAYSISLKLQQLNLERKELENAGLEEAIIQAEMQISKNYNIIIVSGDWHPGVIGIIASRLKDRFHLPSIVISLNEKTNIGKGSCRSVAGIDIGAAILSAKIEGLIIEGGGHTMAAGFSIQHENIENLQKFLLAKFNNISIKKSLNVDGFITVRSINISLWKQLQLLEPFGTGNPEPRFIIAAIRISKAEIIGVNHIKCLISDGSHYIPAIAFRAMNSELGEALLREKVTAVLGKININYWGGNENLQFIIEDAML